MAQKRKLAGRVNVAGTWYGPGDDVPDDVAAQIPNPKAWATDTDDSPETPARVEGGTAGGHRLAGRVNIGGQWYGPDDPVPDDVAAQITNPKAWEGGRLPNVAPAAAPSEMTEAQRLYGNHGFLTPTPADATPTQSPEGETVTPAATASLRVPAPPRSGRGSGLDAWEAYAKSQGVDVPAGATREEIIAACEDAEVLDTDR